MIFESVIETPFGPVTIRTTDALPEGELIVYSPPPPGVKPGDPDWVPLERRSMKLAGLASSDPGGAP